MKSIDDKKRFLDILEETPLISIAAKKAGIAPATIYRWKDKDENFSRKMKKVLREGQEVISDRVESVLVKKALAGEKWAVQMWLESHRKEYFKPKKAISVDFPKDKIEKIITTYVYTDKESYKKAIKEQKEEKEEKNLLNELD